LQEQAEREKIIGNHPQEREYKLRETGTFRRIGYGGGGRNWMKRKEERTQYIMEY
jgi:hypothetical protein